MKTDKENNGTWNRIVRRQMRIVTYLVEIIAWLCLGFSVLALFVPIEFNSPVLALITSLAMVLLMRTIRKRIISKLKISIKK